MKTTAAVLAAATCLAAGLAQGALIDELVGHYPFENSFQDVSASGSSNHGTPVNNPGFATGKIGTGMSLTGTRDHMSLDPTVYPELDFGSGTDFTVSMWVRQDDYLSDPAVFSNKDWSSGDNTGINWAVKGNSPFDLNTKGDTGTRRDLDTVSTSWITAVGAWNLIVMTVDRDGPTELYINGIHRGTIPVTSTGTFNSGLPWNVGQDGTGGYSAEFTGAVDELSIWRRALNSTEADELWNGGAGIDLSAQIVDSTLRLVVDRHTGEITLQNNTGQPQYLTAYEITSEAGALDRAGWNPIAGRLDAVGNGQVDADDNWFVLTQPGSVADLSELTPGTTTLADGASVSLGTGWGKYYQEGADVTFRYDDGVSSEPVNGLVSFVGTDATPFDFGDLDFDGDLDGDDWVVLQSGFATPLASMSTAQRYRAGDLNDDGAHSLADILEFQIAYDEALGAGAFQAMITAVPEPASLGLVVLAVGIAATGFRRLRRGIPGVLLAIVVGVVLAGNAQAVSYFAEDFNGVPLGPSVDEDDPSGTSVWTKTAPTGWTIDDSGVPNGGVTEWRGWSFVDPAWWSDVAEDQLRSQFTKASGAVAVADPDEWDDLDHDSGSYNTFLETPVISMNGAAEGTVVLRFDSSWRPEDLQTANITVSFDSGPDVEVLRWTSNSSDSTYKPDSTNETVSLPLNNPAGATNMQVKFGMTDAGNDWWWAIDNLEVFSPLTLEVDVQTGQMHILGDSTVALKGYEITSAEGTLAPVGWLAGNLDAQVVGNPVAPRTDFSGNGTVDAADVTIWKSAVGVSDAGDADGDGDTDVADLMRLQRELGSTEQPASTWLTFLATENQFVESYLYGSSTFTSDVSIGSGYNTALDRRDLVFTYTTDANELVTGEVRYVNSPSIVGVPEPGALVLVALGVASLLGRRRV